MHRFGLRALGRTISGERFSCFDSYADSGSTASKSRRFLENFHRDECIETYDPEKRDNNISTKRNLIPNICEPAWGEPTG